MFTHARRQFVSAITIVTLCVAMIGVAHAAVAPPNIVSYQGRILNANGVPVTDTSLSVVYKLYDSLTTGTCLWSNSSSTCASQTARTVQLSSGLFSENLGDASASPAYAAILPTVFSNNAGVYLEVVIGGETLSPRKRMTSAPYALNTHSIDGYALINGSGNLGLASNQSLTLGTNVSATKQVHLSYDTLTGAMAGGNDTTGLYVTKLLLPDGDGYHGQNSPVLFIGNSHALDVTGPQINGIPHTGDFANGISDPTIFLMSKTGENNGQFNITDPSGGDNGAFGIDSSVDLKLSASQDFTLSSSNLNIDKTGAFSGSNLTFSSIAWSINGTGDINTTGNILGNNFTLNGSLIIPLANTPGQILVNNASGTAFAPQTISGVIAMDSSGVTSFTGGGGVPFSSLAPLTAGHILVGNFSNVATDTALSGDATLSDTGVLTIGNGRISANKLQSSAADLGAGDVTVNFGNTNSTYNTNITTDGTMTASAGFYGNLTGNVTGNLTGNVTGNVSGSAGSVLNAIYNTDTGTVLNTMLAGNIGLDKLSNTMTGTGGNILNFNLTGTNAVTEEGYAPAYSQIIEQGLMVNYTAGAADMNDIYTAMGLNVTNTTHSGSGNSVNGFAIGDITSDAYATTNAFTIGTGWNNDLKLSSADSSIMMGNTLTFKDTSNNPIFKIAKPGQGSTTLHLSPASPFVLDSTALNSDSYPDLTTGTDQNLDLEANGTGIIKLNDATAVSGISGTTSLAVTANGTDAGAATFSTTASNYQNGLSSSLYETSASGNAGNFFGYLTDNAAGDQNVNSLFVTAGFSNGSKPSGTDTISGIQIDSAGSGIAHTNLSALTIGNGWDQSINFLGMNPILRVPDAGVLSLKNVTGNLVAGFSDISSTVAGLNSHAGTFHLFDDASIQNTQTIDIGGVDANIANTINIATHPTSVDTITIGNQATGTTTILNGGNASEINYANFGVASTGNISVTNNMGLDSKTSGQTLQIGNTNASTLTIGNAATTALNIGTSGGDYAGINIGTGTGVNAINLGNINTNNFGATYTTLALSGVTSISSFAPTYGSMSGTTVSLTASNTTGIVSLSNQKQNVLNVAAIEPTSHTFSTGGSFTGVNVADIADESLNPVSDASITEDAIRIGNGWDSAIHFMQTDSIITVGDANADGSVTWNDSHTFTPYTLMTLTDAGTKGNLSVTGDVIGAGHLTLNSIVSAGTISNIIPISSFAGTIVQTDDLVGNNVDLNTHYQPILGKSTTAYSFNSPIFNNSGVSGTLNFSGLGNTAAGTGNINAGGGRVVNWNGVSITTPNINGDVTANALSGTNGTITSSGTQNIFHAVATGVSIGGTLNGVLIDPITGGLGTETAINIGSGWDYGIKLGSTLGNTIDVNSGAFAVDSSGNITTTGVGKFADGSAAAPSISFASDLGTGLYHVGANDLGVSAGGSQVLDVQSTALKIIGDLTFDNTASAHTISMATDSTNNGTAGKDLIVNAGDKTDGTGDGGTLMLFGGMTNLGNSGGVTIESGNEVSSALTFGAINIGAILSSAITIGNTAHTAFQLHSTNINISAGAITGLTGLTVATGNASLTTGDLLVASTHGIDLPGAGTLAIGDTNATRVNIGSTLATQIDIGAGGALTRAINIGTGTGADTITIGYGATTADTIAIGNTVAGTDVRMNSGTKWQINNAGSGDAWFNFPSSTLNHALCHESPDNTATAEVIEDCTGSPAADYAERYPVAVGITYGDIVMPGTTMITTKDGDSIAQLVKSSLAYQGPVSGIVSNNYGDFTSAGNNLNDSDNPMPVALVGRIPVNVTNENGPIHVGDFVTTSSTPGKGMKATLAGRIVGMALSNFDATTGQVMVQVNNSWYFGSLIGNDGTSTMLTDNVVVAPAGKATASTTSFDSYGLALRGSAWDGNQAQTVSMMFKNKVTDGTNYRLSVRNTTDSEVAYITNTGTMQVAGDMVVGGKLYPSNLGGVQTNKYIYYDGSAGPGGDFMRTNASGWSTGSYDFAEMFPSEETLAPGDVVVFSDKSINVKRSSKSDEKSIAGIVSTRPGFLAGENTPGSFPIALAGRVPTNVNLEGGAIAVGDALTTSSASGFAMKASKAGPIVGYALEAFDGSQGKITVFVSAGYWGGDATSSTPGTDNRASLFGTGGSNMMTSLSMNGNINMLGNEIASIGRLAGLADAWSIEQDGTIKTESLLKTIITGQNNLKVETIAVTSPEAIITLSGSSTLKDGQADVHFMDVNKDFGNVISAIAPIRVVATPNGPVSLYVSEKDQNHFVVKSFGGNASDVEFDWVVTGYRKGYEPVVAPIVPVVTATVPLTTTGTDVAPVATVTTDSSATTSTNAQGLGTLPITGTDIPASSTSSSTTIVDPSVTNAGATAPTSSP